jgi:hypothetical protein
MMMIEIYLEGHASMEWRIEYEYESIEGRQIRKVNVTRGRVCVVM